MVNPLINLQAQTSIFDIAVTIYRKSGNVWIQRTNRLTGEIEKYYTPRIKALTKEFAFFESDEEEGML